MKVWSTIFVKEVIELAPAAVLALLLGFGNGCINADHDRFLPTSIQVIFLAGLCVGLGQGVLDRRLRASGFVRHRPVSDRVWVTARFMAGWFAATMPLLAFFAGRSLLQAWNPPQEREPLAYAGGVTNAMIEHAYWLALVWAYVKCLVAWAVVRATVSVPNRVVAAIFTVLTPVALLFRANISFGPAAPLAAVALVLAIAFSASAYGRVASGGVR